MGEPAIPDEQARREALELARLILDAIRNDSTAMHALLEYCRVDHVADDLERSLWLLASTLVMAYRGAG